MYGYFLAIKGVKFVLALVQVLLALVFMRQFISLYLLLFLRFKFEDIKVSSFTKSSFDKEANDAFIGEVFLNTSKYFLTIWAVIYANIK